MHTAIHRCGQYIREQAKPGWRQSLLLCCTFMAQLGGASAARGEPAAAAHGAPVSGALDCKGLRPSDVRARETAGFLHMCRVIDSGFSRVSAEILLDLRARARDVVAVQTFEAICARGGPNVASLFDQALRLRSSGQRRDGVPAVVLEGSSVLGQLVLGEEGWDIGGHGSWPGRSFVGHGGWGGIIPKRCLAPAAPLSPGGSQLLPAPSPPSSLPPASPSSPWPFWTHSATSSGHTRGTQADNQSATWGSMGQPTYLERGRWPAGFWSFCARHLVHLVWGKQ